MKQYSNPRISVIMGLYNCETTLIEALESLLNQTFQDFKVIMCDDGSIDNTYKVALSYVKNYPDKFILIKNEKNIKLAATLNHCLEYVDTEYVARMDADDVCDPKRFEIQIKFLDDHPEFSHVSSSMYLFDESGIYGQTKCLALIPDKNQFKNSVPYCHAPTMFRKSTLEKVGLYTAHKRVERIEDYYLWYKIHKTGMKGYNLPQPLYSMRNDSNAFKRRKFKDRIRFIPVKIEILRGLNIKFAYYYAFRDALKGLIPGFIVRQLKKKF